jgi:hypothetical protein
MNTTFTKEALATWIDGLMQAAREDEQFSIAWFVPTQNSPVSIVGGWMDGFAPKEADLFCQSRSNPTYAMCIKVCENHGPYAYTDFELMDMPLDESGEVEDNCIALEWEDDPTSIAEFYMIEWERLMEKYN